MAFLKSHGHVFSKAYKDLLAKLKQDAKREAMDRELDALEQGDYE
jgi:hypothetical protein